MSPRTVGPAPVAGIAVEPGSDLVIVFARTQPTGDVRVLLVDSTNVVVQAHDGAASFSSDAERLVVDNASPATFEIHIPRTAPRVEIRLGDRRLFVKNGSRIVSAARALNGTYQLPLQH